MSKTNWFGVLFMVLAIFIGAVFFKEWVAAAGGLCSHLYTPAAIEAQRSGVCDARAAAHPSAQPTMTASVILLAIGAFLITRKVTREQSTILLDRSNLG